jgi:glyoxylase-like metal-dependent hydrolase (beta-lactamase superfamily II)
MTKEFNMTDWSIWSFCYAMGKLPYDFLSGSPIHSNRGKVDAPMLVTLLRSIDGENVLVDTGFEAAASMTGAGFANFVRSDLLLQRFGHAPDSIGKVVLTHMHFDHAGNFLNFPNARIYLQRYEYDAWKQVIDQHDASKVTKADWAFSSLNLNDFAALERAIDAGRVELLEGDAEIADGVTCRLAKDTHTFGSQWVEVSTARGGYVVAGDCCYTFENLARMWPPGYTQGNPWNMLREFKNMKAVAGADLARLIPGHDIELFNRYPCGERDGVRFVEASLAEGHVSLLGAA